MPDHRIRLRGGWDCLYHVGDDPEGLEVVRRVDLPTIWTGEFPRLLRLTRQFGRPPVDPSLEWVELEMRGVGGLKSARLNGAAIALATISADAWSSRIDQELLPRNGLALEVELAMPRGESQALWGEIALVIRPRSSADP